MTVKNRWLVPVAALCTIAVLGVFRPRTVGAQDTKTQWDGVYTAEQAGRGEDLYGSKCGGCHGAELNGGELAPSLTGGVFVGNWSDLTLSDLAERIRTSMPQNNPGSLSREQTADIVAFLLQKGNYPVGMQELPAADALLKTIKFVQNKPGGD